MEKIRLAHKSYSIMVYHKQGETNEKIVFLHGGGLDNALLSWKEVIDLMGNQYDIYAIDLLGYGESDKPDILYSIPMYVEFLHDILTQLNIEKTHVIGLSLGGAISIGFSLKFPQIVDRLVLVDAWGYVDRMPFHAFGRWYVNSWLNAKSYEWLGKSENLIKWSITLSLIGDKNRVTDELVTTLSNLIHQPKCNRPWESLQRYEMGKKKATTDLRSHLVELKMPVLLINGEKDSSVTVKSAIAAGKMIENSRLHIMKVCKHWPQKERPEEFVQVVETFLRDIDI